MLPRCVACLLAIGCGSDPGRAAAPAAPAPRAQSLELDHVWIAVSPGAPERAALEQAGFQIAAKVNQHAGQGTASVTVELDNGFLELLYVDDAVSVAPGREAVKAQFAARAAWRTTGQSPFGIGVRRLAAAPAAFPFRTFRVTADWMPPGTFMEILTPREMPAAVRLFVPAVPSVGPDADPVEPSARIHPNGVHRLTALRVVAPSADRLPPAARYLAERAPLTFDTGGAWLLEVQLDDGAQHARRDLRPALPVVIRY